jgi:hypothetical protein
MKAILKINDKEIEVEVSEEQIEKLTEKKKSPFAKSANGGTYYAIDFDGSIDTCTDYNTDCDSDAYKVANYCTDYNIIQQQAYRETLNRLLWRWQYENDEPCDWESFGAKYGIYFNTGTNEFEVLFANSCKVQTIYFTTKAKAYWAIEEVVKPFMKEHPDFVW